MDALSRKFSNHQVSVEQCNQCHRRGFIEEIGSLSRPHSSNSTEEVINTCQARYDFGVQPSRQSSRWENIPMLNPDVTAAGLQGFVGAPGDASHQGQRERDERCADQRREGVRHGQFQRCAAKRRNKKADVELTSASGVAQALNLADRITSDSAYCAITTWGAE